MFLNGKEDFPLRFFIAGVICLPFTNETTSHINNACKMLIPHCYYED